MLRSHSTEKHSTAVIMSNQPRWGLGSELSWRKQHAGQHVNSTARLRPSTAAPTTRRSLSGSGASSSAAAVSRAASSHRTADRRRGGDGQPDPVARHQKVGAYTLTREQRAERQRAQVFGQVRRALEEKRQLFGTSVNDTSSLFEAADTDHSGSLDRFEFRRAMRRLGIGLSSAQVEQLVEAVDSDRSGEISYEEFVQAIHKPEPEPEPEPEAEQRLDAAASMLRDVESSTSGWEHERPWPEAICPADEAPVDVVRVVAADGSVMHERQGRLGEVELSRDERNYNAKMAARLSSAGAKSTLRIRVVQHSGTNEIGVETAEQGKCYGSGPFFRVEVLGALPVTNIVTRRADGSRPPRMVVREWLKARGWRWNKPRRCWFLDVRHEAHTAVRIDQIESLAEREGLLVELE